MRILALDLGTLTGWATNCRGAIQVGTWKLATAKEVTAWGKIRLTRRQDPRILRLKENVSEFCGEIDAMVFEDILFSSSTLQVQLWSALRAACWLSCDAHVLRECVPVQTLKRFATGAGNADKAMMITRAKKQLPGAVFDDNSADAFWLLQWGIQNLSRAKT